MAIVDRSPITVKHRVIFGIIAVIGAIAWAVIAFFRGETVNAVWFVIAAICTYVIGFRFYARLIEMKIVRPPRDENATPAELFENGTDYMPTDRRVLFGHHFAAIAGAGRWSGPCWPCRWVSCPAPSGSSSARSWPAVCRTTWCWRSRHGGAAARWARWPVTNWYRRRRRRDHRRAGHHGDPARCAGPGRRRRPGRKPLGGCLLDRDDHPDRDLHGPVSAVPAPGPGLRSLADRRGAAPAGSRGRRLGRRNLLGGHRLVHPVQGLAVLGDHHLRLRRLGAAGVVPAGPARLPVDVHEGRHHRPARRRHRAGPPPHHGGPRGLGVRRPRHRTGLRGLAVPVPVHHHRVWCTVGLPRVDLLRHHPPNCWKKKNPRCA